MAATTKNSCKIDSVFPESGIVVDKSLSIFTEQFRKLPTHVVDYLISSMVDPQNPSVGIDEINKVLSEHFIEADQKELVKSKIRERGKFVLIGRLRCRFDETKDEYWADVAALGNQFVRISHPLIEKYGEILLTTGAWGTIEIVFDDSFVVRQKLFPFVITDFRPMQVTAINLDSWIERRNNFTKDEWTDLLVSSIGFDPSGLSEREKMLYMVRLVPFIEANVNMVELGPPETGKTFSCQSLSSHGFVISGSQTTVASLFYDKLRRQLGIIGYRDVVMFDEFGGKNNSKWNSQGDLVDMLKDYLNSGRFGRGTAEFASGCSVFFAGNIDCDRDKRSVSSRYRNLFAPFPNILNRDRAFLDRVHGFIPGWEVPQIREANLSRNRGFAADYFGEIMHRMRDRSYAGVITENVDFGNMGQRNQRAITRICCGLLKLLHPHKTAALISTDELVEILEVAAEMRQRVVSQLEIIAPKEFAGTKLEYQIKHQGKTWSTGVAK